MVKGVGGRGRADPEGGRGVRIFLAGASGVIGVRLIPLLLGAGHVVAGLTRSAAGGEAVRGLGAQPVVGDVFAAAALAAAVTAFQPELVLHQLTDLPDEAARIPEYAARNSRIRTEGTRNLLAAVQAAGAGRFLAQSLAWTPRSAAAAVAEHERLVLSAGGVVLRYGAFYGPGTYFGTERLPPAPRIHVDEAARRTLEALEAPTGVITVVEGP